MPSTSFLPQQYTMEQNFFSQEFAKANEAQKRAISHIHGPLLVIAGAGSGKTRVATMRIANLIQNDIDPSTIIAVTFTNKAAREMKERVRHLTGAPVHVSTFHSLGAMILRETIHLLSYPNHFAIYTEEESQKLIKNILKEKGFPHKEADISSFSRAFSQIKNNFSIFPQQSHVTQSMFEQYQETLKQSGAVDFDDLIFLPLKIFKEHPDTIKNIQKRWHYLLVDEYQDTSSCQSLFAYALAGNNQNIFAVGDPDQSIYSWRGAKIENILKFTTMYPKAEIIRLEQNYRSTNTILSAANAVISHNTQRSEKNLWSQKDAGEAIVCHIAASDRQEAEFVTEAITAYIDAGRSPNDIAILYRTNAQSRPIEDRSIEKKIPYTIWGGTPFYARKEIKDVLSFLQIASLPQDMIAFERAIKTIGKGIGDTTLAKIQEAAKEKNLPILTVAKTASKEEIGLTERQKNSLNTFCAFILKLQSLFTTDSAFATISCAIHDSGYLEIIAKDELTATDRRENLEQLLSRAKEWDELNEGVSATKFLEELLLEGVVENRTTDQPKITLATIHNAKGLEFPIVFIVGLEEDLFPHINAKTSKDAIEEERRLFYVAMTRAKEKLTISASMSRFVFGGTRRMIASRFLKEIPSKFTKSYTTMEKPSHKANTASFVPGQIVLHPQFGIGRIEATTQTSFGLCYEIFFSSEQKTKKIAAEYSSLNLVPT